VSGFGGRRATGTRLILGSHIGSRLDRTHSLPPLHALSAHFPPPPAAPPRAWSRFGPHSDSNLDRAYLEGGGRAGSSAAWRARGAWRLEAGAAQDRDARVARVRRLFARAAAEAEHGATGAGDDLLVDAGVAEPVADGCHGAQPRTTTTTMKAR
jgi:hypothetical protein